MYEKPSHRLWQTLCAGKKKFYKEFWALRDINFEVGKGECVGIMGRNGAGKSTLLQIICGTMQPTMGTVEVGGRVAALLELGSGFNPEFTGRDNVLMNAAIVGLSEKEIAEKYQEIIDFADIGDFIHQPVKTYSSGMMMRLAFAAQSMIDPDVLIVDEALAVGDARFQLKCFRRLEDLRQRGTTILFVSHATEQVKSMCGKALLLEKGSQVKFGDAIGACLEFHNILFPASAEPTDDSGDKQLVAKAPVQTKLNSNAAYKLKAYPARDHQKKWGAGGAKADSVEIVGISAPNVFEGGESVSVYCNYSWDIEFIRSLAFANGLKDDITIGISLANNKGEYIFGCNGFDAGIPVRYSENGNAHVVFSFVMPRLAAGVYFMTVTIAVGDMPRHEQAVWYDYCIELKCAPPPASNVYGFMAIKYEMGNLDDRPE